MIKGRFSWESILIIRNSLVSRVFLVFSSSVFVLSTFKPLQAVVEVSSWRYHLMFLGSMIFFFGYGFSHIRAPSEFKKSPYINDIIRDMKERNSLLLFESRVDLCKKIVSRFRAKTPPDLPDSCIEYAESILETVNKQLNNDWRTEQGELFFCDLNLRQYDRFVSRAVSIGLLILGFAMIVTPTLVSVVEVLIGYFV